MKKISHYGMLSILLCILFYSCQDDHLDSVNPIGELEITKSKAPPIGDGGGGGGEKPPRWTDPRTGRIYESGHPAPGPAPIHNPWQLNRPEEIWGYYYYDGYWWSGGGEIGSSVGTAGDGKWVLYKGKWYWMQDVSPDWGDGGENKDEIYDKEAPDESDHGMYDYRVPR